MEAVFRAILDVRRSGYCQHLGPVVRGGLYDPDLCRQHRRRYLAGSAVSEDQQAVHRQIMIQFDTDPPFWYNIDTERGISL